MKVSESEVEVRSVSRWLWFPGMAGPPGCFAGCCSFEEHCLHCLLGTLEQRQMSEAGVSASPWRKLLTCMFVLHSFILFLFLLEGEQLLPRLGYQLCLLLPLSAMCFFALHNKRGAVMALSFHHPVSSHVRSVLWLCGGGGGSGLLSQYLPSFKPTPAECWGPQAISLRAVPVSMILFNGFSLNCDIVPQSSSAFGSGRGLVLLPFEYLD